MPKNVVITETTYRELKRMLAWWKRIAVDLTQPQARRQVAPGNRPVWVLITGTHASSPDGDGFVYYTGSAFGSGPAVAATATDVTIKVVPGGIAIGEQIPNDTPALATKEMESLAVVYRIGGVSCL